MVQGPLLLRQTRIVQRQQGCRVGKRYIEAVREFDTRGECRELQWFLRFIELDCFVDNRGHLEELSP